MGWVRQCWYHRGVREDIKVGDPKMRRLWKNGPIQKFKYHLGNLGCLWTLDFCLTWHGLAVMAMIIQLLIIFITIVGNTTTIIASLGLHFSHSQKRLKTWPPITEFWNAAFYGADLLPPSTKTFVKSHDRGGGEDTPKGQTVGKSLVWSDFCIWSVPYGALYSTLPTLLARVLAERCHMADVKFGPQMTTSSMVKKPLFIIFYLLLRNWSSVKFYTEAYRREGKLSHEEDCSWILLGGRVVLVGGLVGCGQRGKIITVGGCSWTLAIIIVINITGGEIITGGDCSWIPAIILQSGLSSPCLTTA